MLRITVLLLVLLNGGYWAWTQGWLPVAGLTPTVESEPQRLQQQLRPEMMRVLSPEDAQRLAAEALQPRCLQLGPLSAAQVGAVHPLLADWPAGSWRLLPQTAPVRWLIYMGRFPDAAARARKADELKVLHLTFGPPGNPALEPGLSLGQFSTQAQAQTALDSLQQRGVRTARVVRDEGVVTQMLQVPAADAALRDRLEALRPALAGQSPQPCAP